MFIIRETFTAKPGNASKLAKMFREAFSATPLANTARVLTDFIGPFNTVVLENQTEDLASFEKQMQEFMNDPKMREKMTGYTEMYLGGRREIYRIVE